MSIDNIIDFIRLPFRKDKELYVSLRQILGFYPRDIHHYQQALMHKSIGHREKGKPVNNERLEFLGDAILGATVGHIVYSHFTGKREGFLTNTRSKIVQRGTLNRLAQEMGIDQLILSNGHNSSHNNYMGGNAFEALVGAIYLDRGYDACMKFMEKRILKELINLDKVAFKEVNFKSKLLEWSQKNRVKLEYALLKEEKDTESGSPKFYYQAMIEGVEGEKGEGFSKKEAQQQASKLTLQRLRKNPQFIDAIFKSKTQRTQMEEMPVSVAPDVEQTPDNFINNRSEEDSHRNSRQEKNDDKKRKGTSRKTDDEFDLSDITASPKEESREDIIAAAEGAAFAEHQD